LLLDHQASAGREEPTHVTELQLDLDETPKFLSRVEESGRGD